MTLSVGSILVIEAQPDGQQRKFKVLELSYPHREQQFTQNGMSAPIFERQTQLVRLEVVE